MLMTTVADAARRLQADPTDDEAATTLARRAGQLALRTALAATGDADLAGDVAQDAAIRALGRIDSLRDPQAADAWLARIAANETLSALRRRRRRERRESPLDDDDATEPADVAAADRFDRVSSDAATRAALSRLPADQRVALALRYVCDLTQAEVAAALGCRPGTAGSLLSRGRAALRADPALAPAPAPAAARPPSDPETR